MANPIVASTRAFLEGLDITVREAAEAVVAGKSAKAVGIEMTLEEEINLAKAVKFVASADGLSREELGALKFLMIMAAIPHELQKHVADFDVSEVTLGDVGDLFPSASRKAAYVLSGATAVAAFDGLSTEELEEARKLGARFGLEERFAEAVIAHAWAMGLAMSRGDGALVDAHQRLRDVLLSWI